MDKISWTNRVKNEEALQRVKDESNILHTIERWKADSVGHILRRNCLVKHVIEGRMKGQEEEEEDVSSYLKGKREYSKLKEEALDCSPWEIHF